MLHSLGDHAASSAAQTAASSPIGEALSLFAKVFKLPGGKELFDRSIDLAKLWLWTAPLAVLLAGVGFWRHRTDTRFQLLLASAALTLLGYLFVPLNQGHGWGFRYFHSAWFVLPVFAAAALAPARGSSAPAPTQPGPVAHWARAGALGGLLIMIPYFAWQVHAFIGSCLAQLPAANHGEPRVVIVNTRLGYYNQDLVQNDPFLRQPVIRMATRGREEDKRMMAEQFPDLVLLSRDPRGTVWGRASANRSD
jgi:hypothetical protein